MFRVFTSDQYEVPLPPGHRFPIGKYRMLRDALLQGHVLEPQQLREPDPASFDHLALAHEPEYVSRALRGKLLPGEIRRLGFPWSPELIQRARCSVGGTVEAARAALFDGVGGNLAGGTHHAHASFGSGYCTFNDVAVAVRVLKQEGLIKRALVVDLDVHQGDGTAQIFSNDETVFTFSMHGKNNFPFRKFQSDLDVALDDGVGDGAYLSRLECILDNLLNQARPDIVFYLAGVDPLHADCLGRLSLTHAGLRQRDACVMAACVFCGCPLVLVLAGGYAEPIQHSVDAHVGTYRALNAILKL